MVRYGKHFGKYFLIYLQNAWTILMKLITVTHYLVYMTWMTFSRLMDSEVKITDNTSQKCTFLVEAY